MYKKSRCKCTFICCFANETYCFFLDVLVTVTVIGSEGPYYRARELLLLTLEKEVLIVWLLTSYNDQNGLVCWLEQVLVFFKD